MEYSQASQNIVGSIIKPGINRRLRPVGLINRESEIIESIKKGDSSGYEILVRQYENFVHTLILTLTNSAEFAEDISQEVFLRAYKGLRCFQQKSSFKTWLYRITYNTTMAYLNREKSQNGRGAKIEREIEDNSFKQQANKLTIEKLLGKLKPEFRAVIMLHYYQGLKYEEISEVLGCPMGTVKIRLYRAKHELRKLWDRYAS